MDRLPACGFNALMGDERRGEVIAVEESHLLLELVRTVTSTLDLQDVLDQCLTSLRRLVDFGGGAIQLIEDGALVAAATDPPATPEARALRIPLGQGVSGTIAVTGEIVYIPDIAVDSRVHWEGRVDGVTFGVRSYFGVPLIMHGEPIGVVQIDAPTVDAFSAGARALILSFVPTIAAAVQNALLFKREIETIEQLREAEQIKDDFLSLASHELRTPLTSLSGFAATLAQRSETLDRETISDFAARMWRAAQQLERLIADLVDVSRVDHGGLKAEIAPMPLEPVLRQAVESAETDQPVTLAVAPDLPAVLADASRFRQIMLNLLSNARKFSSPGTPIEVRADRHGTLVSVKVIDHGSGIPADQMTRIFERFVQVEPVLTRRAGGLGVGLYLVKKLCQSMGAQIQADSRVGEGSTFTVFLRTVRG